MKDEIHPWFQTGNISTPILSKVAHYLCMVLNVDDGGFILDAGCGNAELLSLLHQHGWRDIQLFGCDIEPTHVDMARRHTGLPNLFQVDMASDDVCVFGDLKFSAIIAINWLHNDWRFKHAINVERRDETDKLLLDRVMKNIIKLLKPGGWFICDYRTCLPGFLIKSIDQFFDNVLSLGFTLQHLIKDVRPDTTKVVTWFFQLQSDDQENS